MDTQSKHTESPRLNTISASQQKSPCNTNFAISGKPNVGVVIPGVHTKPRASCQNNTPRYTATFSQAVAGDGTGCKEIADSKERKPKWVNRKLIPSSPRYEPARGVLRTSHRTSSERGRHGINRITKIAMQFTCSTDSQVSMPALESQNFPNPQTQPSNPQSQHINPITPTHRPHPHPITTTKIITHSKESLSTTWHTDCIYKVP